MIYLAIRVYSTMTVLANIMIITAYSLLLTLMGMCTVLQTFSQKQQYLSNRQCDLLTSYYTSY